MAKELGMTKDRIVIRQREMQDGGASLFLDIHHNGKRTRELLKLYLVPGNSRAAMADDFILIDCGEFPDDPNDAIRTGQKLYIENLKDGRKDFFQLNTRVTIENGMITEIKRHWIP